MTIATNEFPMPANLRPAAGPPPTAPVSHPVQPSQSGRRMQVPVIFAPAGQETFILDPDLRPALEDMCAAAEGRQWKERWSGWLGQLVSEALRNYLRG